MLLFATQCVVPERGKLGLFLRTFELLTSCLTFPVSSGSTFRSTFVGQAFSKQLRFGPDKKKSIFEKNQGIMISAQDFECQVAAFSFSGYTFIC